MKGCGMGGQQQTQEKPAKMPCFCTEGNACDYHAATCTTCHPQCVGHPAVATTKIGSVFAQVLPSIPAHSNPYQHDRMSAGMYVANNLEVMYSTDGDGDAVYAILVNPKTGERIRILFK